MKLTHFQVQFDSLVNCFLAGFVCWRFLRFFFWNQAEVLAQRTFIPAERVLLLLLLVHVFVIPASSSRREADGGVLTGGSRCDAIRFQPSSEKESVKVLRSDSLRLQMEFRRWASRFLAGKRSVFPSESAVSLLRRSRAFTRFFLLF